MQGQFFIIATPIGNLDDITLRAVEVLKSLDIIFAEDTRVTTKLLNHLNIKKPLKSLHEHNEAAKIPQIIDLLNEGKCIGLVSDAGTPLVSDPGSMLIKHLHSHDIHPIPIPGASALSTFMSVCPIQTKHSIFVGFLPVKAKPIKDLLDKYLSIDALVIGFESPHRIIKTIEVLSQYNANLSIVLAKELTKIHETVISGTPQTILAWLNKNPSHKKGEFVIGVNGAQPSENRDLFLKFLQNSEDLTKKQILTIATKVFGQSKNSVYAKILNKLEL